MTVHDKCSESSQFQTVVIPKSVFPPPKYFFFGCLFLFYCLGINALKIYFHWKTDFNNSIPLHCYYKLEKHLNIRCRPYSDFQMQQLEVIDTNLPQVTLVSYLILLLIKERNSEIILHPAFYSIPYDKNSNLD